MLGQQVVADFGDVGHSAAACDQTVVHATVVALHRDVQRHAVAGDRHRVIASDQGPREVHRKRSAGHVRDGDVGDRRNHVDQPRATEHGGHAGYEPRCTEHREVVEDDRLELVHGRLRRVRRCVDLLEPCHRILDVRRKAHQDHAGLVVGGLVTGFAQAHRDGAHHRLFG